MDVNCNGNGNKILLYKEHTRKHKHTRKSRNKQKKKTFFKKKNQ